MRMSPLSLVSILVALAPAAALVGAGSAEARQGAFVARGQHGTAAGVAGPRGAAVRGGRTVTNADGSVTHQSGAAYRGVNGGAGSRTSSTTANTDGSYTHSGQTYTNGPNGSVNSSNNFTRSADGTWSGSSSTSATNANTGKSYTGSTTIDPTTGQPVHSGTCTDSAGNVVACR